MVTTMNGHTRIDSADDRLTTITAGGHSTRVKAGDAATVLEYVGRRFHAEVEPLTTFYGWRSLATNTASGGISNSNHLSGTALDCNGYAHPRYKHGTFTVIEEAALRRILDDINRAAGAVVIRWGGDWGTQVDEMHVELVGTSAALARAATAIRAGQLVSAGGATTGAVPTAPSLTAPDPIEEDPMSAAESIAELKNLGAKLDQVLAKIDVTAEIIGIPIAEGDRTKGQHFYLVNWLTGTKFHLNSRALAYLKARGQLDIVEWQPTSTLAGLVEIK